jgi:hypothetical protein
MMINAEARGPAVYLRIGLAALAAMAVNTAIALAVGAVDSRGLKIGLAPVAYLSLTLFGVLVGAAGWALIARRSPGALRVVVPAVVVVTWIPDLLLINAGATAVNIAGLMVMHAVVAAAVVAAFRVGVRHPVSAGVAR